MFIYGGTGLGKTHLMHAVGNMLRDRNGAAKVVYQPSEHFVADMVRALQHNAINEFKQQYRALDALLIDDIQFFAARNAPKKNFFILLTTCWKANSRSFSPATATLKKYPAWRSG